MTFQYMELLAIVMRLVLREVCFRMRNFFRVRVPAGRIGWFQSSRFGLAVSTLVGFLMLYKIFGVSFLVSRMRGFLHTWCEFLGCVYM